jgi:hypothetical protein
MYEKFIERWGLQSKPHPQARDCAFYAGHIPIDPDTFQVPVPMIEVRDWRLGLARVIWVDIANTVVLTYCEGDLMLEVFEDPLAFGSAMVAMRQFYREEAAEQAQQKGGRAA